MGRSSARCCRQLYDIAGHRRASKAAALKAWTHFSHRPDAVEALVATVAINGAKNAALLAVQTGATSDPELAAKYKAYREKMSRDVMEKNDKLQQHLNTAGNELQQGTGHC